MRRSLGVLVLCLGTGGLAWYASQFTAANIERQISKQARAALDQSVHGATADVSGRDITLSGILSGEAERETLLAALSEVPGHRTIRDETELLRLVSPFTLAVEWDGTRTSRLRGHVPNEQTRRELGGFVGAAAGTLELAAGAPDENWGDFALRGFAALRNLKTGSLSITDAEMTLTGVAANPDARAVVDSTLSGIPEGYSVNLDVRTEDDGQPFGFSVRYARGADALVRGKLPVTMSGDNFEMLDAEILADEAQIAEIPSPDGMFPERAEVLVGALSQLEEGLLSVRETSATLTGSGTRASLVAVEEQLKDLPADFMVSTTLTIFDDGAPIEFLATKAAEGTQLAGKLPFGAAPAEYGLDAFGADVVVAEIEAQSDAFGMLSQAGLAALAQMEDGTARIEDAETPRLLLEGRVTSPAVAEEIEAVLNRAPGTVELSLSAMDNGEPLSLSSQKTSDGISTTGKLPMDAALDLGPGVSQAGIPLGPEGFEDAARAGIGALGELASGSLKIDGTDVVLEGSGTRAALARSIDALEALPDGYESQVFLDPLDDGLPLGLTAEKAGDVVTMVGKMPFGTEPQALGLEAFGEAMIVSEIDAKSGDFIAVSQAGLAGLAALETGTLTVADAAEPNGAPTLVLSGDVTRSGLEAVNRALGNLPSGVAPSIDVVFADDGLPMALTGTWDGAALGVEGKVPLGTTAENLKLEALGDRVVVAEIAGKSDAFNALAARGFAAVQLLESGQVDVFDAVDVGGTPTVSISGVATTPAARDEALQVLRASDAAIDITVLDDGTPPAFSLTYDAAKGATLAGKLPTGLSAAGVAKGLGLSGIQSSATAGLTGDADPAVAGLAKLADWLPEADILEASFDADGLVAVKVTPSPGVDAELLTDAMAQALGVAVTVTDPLPVKPGAQRVNALTGVSERFAGVAWVPGFGFEPSLAACDAESRAILEATKINFVTASARLEAQSARAVNGLAGVIGHCLDADPDLRVELAGHTDSDGSESGNLALSQERADAVAAALVARGVPETAITAVGYGESQPVASNDTAEGRAANRRTELTWIDG